ncbi:MAG: xanthine dehydrogenase family protein molybdopterin-binding subunit [Candidatus Dormibacteraeota bacterium]|nr:xanthine dehydrogenase family protein molybdopterin-binding subunit [Candidatus Dormibacteraeota bacterium]
MAIGEITIPGSVLGHAVRRVEDPRFITGRGEYCDDLPLATGGLHVAFFRSPVPHAKLLSVDVETAASMPGVVGVFRDHDLGLPAKRDMSDLDPVFSRPHLARDVVRFTGEPIVAVVATERGIAEDAAEAVFCDFDPLPAVGHMQDALDDSGPLLFPEHGTNRAYHVRNGTQDEDVLAGAEVTLKARIVNQRLAPVPLEPDVTVAEPDGEGVRVWVSTQNPHQVRDEIASKLGLDPGLVRVIAPDVGGGFGAKGSIYAEQVMVAALARRLGKQVRWVESRSENLLNMVHGRAQINDVEVGATRDGRITGLRVHVLQDAGGYPAEGAWLPTLTGWMMSGVYDLRKIDFRATAVATNTTPVAAYRGAGRPEAAHLLERTVDLLAAELGMDPVEVRRRNFIRPDQFPYQTVTGVEYDSGDYEKPLREALQRAGYDELRREQAERRARGDRRLLGVGVATYVEVTGLGSPTEHGAVEVHPDGEIVVLAGTSGHGQGHATTYAQMVAEQLQVPVEQIRFIQSDTAQVPTGGGTGGSRSMQMGGMAINTACGEVLERGRHLAAEELEADPQDLEVSPGGFRVRGVPQSVVTWHQLAVREGGPKGIHSAIDFERQGLTYPFGAHVAVVEVDRETGDVRLLRHVAVDDCGPILNPLLAQGQQHGGIAQGAAQALFEEVVFDADGSPLSASLIDYQVPTVGELPAFETAFTQTPSPHNSLGVKGIGEAPTIGSTPAIHNAVVDALSHLGVRHVDMPMTPEKLWRAIQEASR